MNSWVRVRTVGLLLLGGAAVLPATSLGAPRHRGSRRRDAGNAQTVAQLPYRIRDSFNGTSVNPAVWVTDEQTFGTSRGVQDGSLRLSASSAAGSGFHDGILTRCKVVGDFDARIRFTLSVWPTNDNVSLAVNAYPLGNTFVASAVGGNALGIYVPPGNAARTGHITMPASAHGGLLRLSRRGNLVSAYFRSGPTGSWNRLGQLIGSTSPTFVGVAIWNVSDFGGQTASVQVESFKLDAAGLSC